MMPYCPESDLGFDSHLFTDLGFESQNEEK